MNLEQLTALVARGESEHLEFKRSTGSLNEGVKTVCAMLNSPLPGYVLFGVNDRGEIVGQEISTRTLEELANELRKIEPPALPDVEQVDLDHGRSVLAISVSGGTGLYAYDGRPYHRIGPTTSRMPMLRYSSDFWSTSRRPIGGRNGPPKASRSTILTIANSSAPSKRQFAVNA